MRLPWQSLGFGSSEKSSAPSNALCDDIAVPLGQSVATPDHVDRPGRVLEDGEQDERVDPAKETLAHAAIEPQVRNALSMH